jgi:hypothetical protein
MTEVEQAEKLKYATLIVGLEESLNMVAVEKNII